MNKIIDYLKTRSIGFYLCCGAAVLSIVEAIVYKNAITDSRYYSAVSFFLALFAFLPFAALCIFKQTEKFAPTALTLMIFLSLLLFLAPQSGYIGDIIYGAVPSAAYITTIVLLVINLGLGIAGIFTKMSKKEKPQDDRGLTADLQQEAENAK